MAATTAGHGPYGFTFTLRSRTSRGSTPSSASSAASAPPWTRGQAPRRSPASMEASEQGHGDPDGEEGRQGDHAPGGTDVLGPDRHTRIAQPVVAHLLELHAEEPCQRGHGAAGVRARRLAAVAQEDARPAAHVGAAQEPGAEQEQGGE